MTKYVIFGDNLYKNVKKMMDYPPKQEFMNRMNGARMTKIFQNPITAIAYDICTAYDLPDNGNDYQMDKKDIIRALDFWINDKILENEKLLQLHNNKLEDFHEYELKSLINAKTKVQKMDNDVVFTRFNNNEHDRAVHLGTDNIEFYYQVKVDPIEEERQDRRRIETISNSNTVRNRTISGILSDLINSPWGGARTDIMHATGPTRTVPFPGAEEFLRTGNNLQPTYMRFEDMYVNTVNTAISNNIEVQVEFRGSNGAEMTVHLLPNHGVHTNITTDGPHTIQLLDNSRIQIDAQEYALTQPVNVSWENSGGIMSTTSGFAPQIPGNDTDFMDYTNMTCVHIHGNDFTAAGDNSYVTTDLAYVGSLVDISLTVYVTGREIDQVSSSLSNHRIRIFEHRKDVIEIDGQRIHVLSMDVTYK